jgi:thermostable 8-oxoguanine DNA glycosylase
MKGAMSPIEVMRKIEELNNLLRDNSILCYLEGELRSILASPYYYFESWEEYLADNPEKLQKLEEAVKLCIDTTKKLEQFLKEIRGYV